MRLLVTGRNGQVAKALLERAAQLQAIRIVAVGRPQLDLENTATIYAALAAARPDFIVNAAAYTAVDKAEGDPQRAFAVNRDGAAGVAAAARRLAVPLIHLSTDYVFSGDKETAYVESDDTGPLGIYGKSKLAGEVAVRTEYPRALILRTSWVYSPFGNNFVKTMLRLAGERSALRVVDDQVGTPTSALDLADAILSIVPLLGDGGGAGSTLHIAGAGASSWCGLARQAMETSRAMGGPWAEVAPIASAEYSTPAQRPANSRLDSSAFAARFGFTLPDWHSGVEATVRRLLRV